MPPVKFSTEHGQTAPVRKVHGSEYTDAQWKALPGLKQTTPKLKLGAARSEFVNKVLLPDGTISTDTAIYDKIVAATLQHDVDDKTRLASFVSGVQDRILTDELTLAEKRELHDLRYWAKHNQNAEFIDHWKQERFLFIVDANLIPRIYFQCVTPTNIDIEYVNDAEDPHFAERSGLREQFKLDGMIRRGEI